MWGGWRGFDGREALQLVGTLIPKVVISGYEMPGWDGAETTRRILKEYPSDRCHRIVHSKRLPM